MLSASVAMVQCGIYSVEGIKTEEGEYFIAIPQIADLFKTSRNTASRDFKRLLGEDFKPSKMKTEFNTSYTNAIDLPQFEKLLVKLDRSGNKLAQDFRDSLTGLGLKQVFDDAFHVKTTPQTRQDFLSKWQITREQARNAHPLFQETCKRLHYPAHEVHDSITKAIFGDTAEEARQKPLVDEMLDPTIGLNHQEDSEEMILLAKVKWFFSSYRKGTWQEKVVRAVDAVK